MTSARISRLYIAMAATGAAVTGLSLALLMSTVTFDIPAAATLMGVCGRWVLPHPSAGAALVLALGSLSVAALARGAWSVRAQVRAQRRLVAALPVTRRASCDAADVTVLGDDRPQAFCAGFLRPRVYLSTGALARLSDAELEAVLAHERHHAARHDPLRLLIAHMLSDGLFFLPAMRTLAKRYAAVAELAADRAAVEAAGGRGPLARALLTFEESAGAGVVGIAPERVDQLMGEMPRWQMPAAVLAWTVTVLGATLAMLWRASDAAATTTLNMPLLAAQLCMFAMVALPVAVGAAALLAGRRLAWRARQR